MKYELVKTDTKEWNGKTLYRIRALVAIAAWAVKIGDLGGYIETEKCLEQTSDARVSGDARVFGNARVSGDAQIINPQDIQWHTGVGSSCDTLTVYRTKTSLELTRGCFKGNLAKFRQAVRDTHHDSPKIENHYLGLCNLIALWFDLPDEIES